MKETTEHWNPVTQKDRVLPSPAYIAMQTTQQHFDQSASKCDIPFTPVADPRKPRNGPMSTS